MCKEDCKEPDKWEDNRCVKGENEEDLPATVCGNGNPEEGEQCDDGNATSGDGCSDTCQVECPSGYSYHSEYSRCLKDFLDGSAHPLAQDSNCKGPDVVYGGVTGDDDYGWRNFAGKVHEGVDVRAADMSNCKVNAVATGKVLYSGDDGTGANMIDISHNSTYITRYLHGADLLLAKEQIAYIDSTVFTMGNTGKYSGGVHLHIGLKKNGTLVDPQEDQYFSYLGRDHYQLNSDGTVRYDYDGVFYEKTTTY